MHKQKMNVVKMHMFCWILGNFRRDKVRNEDILAMVGVASIEENMHEKCLQ